MLPLAGVRVVEFASNVAGPYATLVLQDLGASVVKIERPVSGDDVRGWPPFDADHVSAPFTAINRGKRSVELDIKNPRGLAVLHELLARADVFVSSLRPGKSRGLRLDAGSLAETAPHLVVCEISGYGPKGPLAMDPGYDAILQAYSGIMSITGHADGPPARVGTAMLDFGTGMWAALGAIAALYRRNETGAGSSVAPSLLGTASAFLTHHVASRSMAGVEPQRIGTAQHNSAPYEAITAADAQVMVGVTSPALWRSLCEQLGCPELITHPDFESNAVRVANRRRLVELLSGAIAHRRAADVVAGLRAVGVPASVIRRVGDLVDDPQAAAVGLIQESAAGAKLAAVPVVIDGELADLSHQRAPELGEHTRDVLQELGFSGSSLLELADSGAIRLAAEAK